MQGNGLFSRRIGIRVLGAAALVAVDRPGDERRL
jgi:hypothetical protein